MKDLQGSLDAASRQYAEGCVKTQEDLNRYAVVLEATKPDVIIECGTFSGKSALWLTRMSGAAVITIDTAAQIDDDTWVQLREHPVVALTGNTVDPFIASQVRGYVQPYSRVMVILDSDHSATHVAAELATYAPLVTVGCYCVVEDGLVRWMTGQPYVGSPLDAIEAWVAAHPEWVVDTDIEDLYSTTQFPSGWLRRAA